MKRTEVLKKQYEIIRYFCYQLIDFEADFENKFPIKSDTDKETCELIKELYKTLQDDAFTTAELLYEILDGEEENSIKDDDCEILSFIEAEESEAS